MSIPHRGRPGAGLHRDNFELLGAPLGAGAGGMSLPIRAWKDKHWNGPQGLLPGPGTCPLFALGQMHVDLYYRDSVWTQERKMCVCIHMCKFVCHNVHVKTICALCVRCVHCVCGCVYICVGIYLCVKLCVEEKVCVR